MHAQVKVLHQISTRVNRFSHFMHFCNLILANIAFWSKRAGGLTSSSRSAALTSYIQSIVARELCKGRHVIWIVGQLVGLFGNTACRLLDAFVI